MRPGLTWIIVGGLVGVAVFAGLDALRSSDEPPLAERDKRSSRLPAPASFTFEGHDEPLSEPAVGEPVLHLHGSDGLGR